MNMTTNMNVNVNNISIETIVNKPEVYKNEPFGNEVTFKTMDSILENEKITNKTDTWIKLSKYEKLQRLYIFAESYGSDKSLKLNEIASLKHFFSDCVDKNKINRTRDVVYNKDTQIIASIPALHFNTHTQNFTLKITDEKRVSTIKSLTPKRTTAKISTSCKTDTYIHYEK